MTSLTLIKGKTVATITEDEQTVSVLLSFDGYPDLPYTHRTDDPAARFLVKVAEYEARGFTAACNG